MFCFRYCCLGSAVTRLVFSCRGCVLLSPCCEWKSLSKYGNVFWINGKDEDVKENCVDVLMFWLLLHAALCLWVFLLCKFTLLCLISKYYTKLARYEKYSAVLLDPVWYSNYYYYHSVKACFAIIVLQADKKEPPVFSQASE